MSDDFDTAMSIDKPGVRSLTTTSQLQAQIDLCAAEIISLQQFYIYVATELGSVSLADWDYLAANNCEPSIEMVRSLLKKIAAWNVVELSKLILIVQ
jgi:hypothetical protein